MCEHRQLLFPVVKTASGVNKAQAGSARIAKQAKLLSEAKTEAKQKTSESVNALWLQIKEEIKKDLAKAK